MMVSTGSVLDGSVSPEVDSGKALQHSLQGLRRVEGLQTVAIGRMSGDRLYVKLSCTGYTPRS